MSLKSVVSDIGIHLKNAYDAVEEMGGELPEQKNFANLAVAVDSISVAPPYDPGNPTIEGLKAAVDAGDYTAFPVGVEIPDTYAGIDNPLIVAQYLDSTNNSAYGGAEGVILIRKYSYPGSDDIGSQFGSNAFYKDSAIRSYLNNTYLQNCSAELKTVLSNITIKTYRSGSGEYETTNDKWFMMSVTEVYGSSSYIEGIAWDYWKGKTGFTTPSNNANPGRVIPWSDASFLSVWLRTCRDYNNVQYVNTSGAISYSDRTHWYNILPACFIAKGGS